MGWCNIQSGGYKFKTILAQGFINLALEHGTYDTIVNKSPAHESAIYIYCTFICGILYIYIYM